MSTAKKRRKTSGKKTVKRGPSRGFEVLVAKRAGFCFGVKRAMDIAFSMANEGQKGVYTLGPIIHNPQVIEKLRSSGVSPVDVGQVRKRGIRTLIIRTHGIPRQLCDTISAGGCRVVDATCPFVKKAQH